MNRLLLLWKARNSRFFKALSLAVLVAVLITGVNELGQHNAGVSVDQMINILNTRSKLDDLLGFMIDAESGQRGYLLTGDKVYLQPYQAALSKIDSAANVLRDAYSRDANQINSFANLESNIQRKLTELDIAVQLRGSGDDAAWKGTLASSLSKELMDSIRQDVEILSETVTIAYDEANARVRWAMILSRLSLVMTTFVALVAFYFYLKKSQQYELDSMASQNRLRAERDRFENQVVERTAQLRSLADYLQTLQETERGNLARELHDELGSLLTAAKLDVARLRSQVGPDATEPLKRIKHLSGVLDMVIAIKRQIIEDLRPSSLVHLGLKSSIEILAREFEQNGGTKTSTDIDDVNVSPEANLTLFRLVQESLTNITKYAKASAVQIVLKQELGVVRVEVVDDGVGFDPSATVVFRHGLAGMRHRLEAAHGTLNVKSSPSIGTRILGILPVDTQSQSE